MLAESEAAMELEENSEIRTPEDDGPRGHVADGSEMTAIERREDLRQTEEDWRVAIHVPGCRPRYACGQDFREVIPHSPRDAAQVVVVAGLADGSTRVKTGCHCCFRRLTHMVDEC